MLNVAFDDPVIRVAQAEARASLGAFWSIGGALAHFSTSTGDEEVQLRLQASVAMPLRGWTFENRHLVVLGAQSGELYRLRVRAISPPVFPDSKLNIRTFDEVYIGLEGSRQVRNTLAAGLGMALGRRSTVELYHVWSREPGGARSTYLQAFWILRAHP